MQTWPFGPFACEEKADAVQVDVAAADAASFTLVAQHVETVAAEGFFKHVLATKPPTEPGKAPDPFRNLAAHIEAGILAPTELILAKDG